MNWNHICLLAAFAVAPVTPLLAADVASIEIIGFSPDQKIFAFEEYGIQDGSGFPYSNIYAIDLTKDAYVPGSPYKVLIEKEEPIFSARAESYDKAADLINGNKLLSNPGQIVWYSPATEVESSADKAVYFPYPSVAGQQYTLKLDTIDLPVPDACKSYDTVIKGFRLTMTQASDQVVNKLLHEDKKIPASRGCVNSYRLGAVVTSFASDSVFHVALIQVNTWGFEGNDGRWIAVPVSVAP